MRKKGENRLVQVVGIIRQIRIKNENPWKTEENFLPLQRTIYWCDSTQKRLDMEYMSQEGYDKLVAEIHELECEEYPKVKEALIEAREKGDLSENFEYHAAKRAQGKLISKIRFKRRVLQFARVLDTNKISAETGHLLTQVELTNLGTGSRMAYTIVNPHEANLQEKKISIKSPIAQALIGKKKGDVVEVHVPAGIQQFRIEGISQL